KMTPLNSCRGPHGCRVLELPEEKKIEFVCDDALAQEGDPCDEESEHACSMDHKALYICRSAKFVSYKACPDTQGCNFDEKGEKFSCDTASNAGRLVDVKKPVSPAIPHKPGK